jgi:hypothetical protein
MTIITLCFTIIINYKWLDFEKCPLVSYNMLQHVAAKQIFKTLCLSIYSGLKTGFPYFMDDDSPQCVRVQKLIAPSTNHTTIMYQLYPCKSQYCSWLKRYKIIMKPTGHEITNQQGCRSQLPRPPCCVAGCSCACTWAETIPSRICRDWGKGDGLLFNPHKMGIYGIIVDNWDLNSTITIGYNGTYWLPSGNQT